MGERKGHRERPPSAPRGAGRSAKFWDDVEREIEELDPADLAEFLAADRDPTGPSPEFRRALRERLRARLRDRAPN